MQPTSQGKNIGLINYTFSWWEIRKDLLMGRFWWWPHCPLPCIHIPLRCDSVAPSSQSQGLFPHPVTLGWLVACFDQHQAADVTLCPSLGARPPYIHWYVCSLLKGPCPASVARQASLLQGYRAQTTAELCSWQSSSLRRVREPRLHQIAWPRWAELPSPP